MHKDQYLKPENAGKDVFTIFKELSENNSPINAIIKLRELFPELTLNEAKEIMVIAQTGYKDLNDYQQSLLNQRNKITELEHGAKQLGLSYEILDTNEGAKIIDAILKKFQPNKTTGHLAIDSQRSIKFSTEENEFSFTKDFEEEPVYLFFEQDEIHKGWIFVLHNGRELCNLLEHCFGMEYFISNKQYQYLISVNWYTIEICHSRS
ncbi:hypothetical protein AAEO56_01170 [Flavobacterium sp. DGU11]|uniref:Uncharacterized protein n=1 Tax=Flavobacterium arundinis TaxID=3139143 RepID=A0ABU9HRS2_9FLAO